VIVRSAGPAAPGPGAEAVAKRLPEQLPPGQTRLPALLNGSSAIYRAPSAWWHRAATATGLGGAGLFVTDLVDQSHTPWGLGGLGLILATSALRRRGTPRRPLYPHLGRMTGPWRSAGASPRQLEILDEAHRLYELTPPVGYRDRQTVVNPLADAYAIFTSAAWRDPWLADRKLAIDPVEEAAEILDHLYKVTTLLGDVRQQLKVLPAGSPVVQTYRGYERALLSSVDDGLRRAKALTAYRGEVRRLETVLLGSRALADAQTFGDRVLDVVSESARHELATQQLDDSRAQLAMLESGLREITELLGTTPQLPAEPRR